jgi:hypothetical protein
MPDAAASITDDAAAPMRDVAAEKSIPDQPCFLEAKIAFPGHDYMI